MKWLAWKGVGLIGLGLGLAGTALGGCGADDVAVDVGRRSDAGTRASLPTAAESIAARATLDALRARFHVEAPGPEVPRAPLLAPGLALGFGVEGERLVPAFALEASSRDAPRAGVELPRDARGAFTLVDERSGLRVDVRLEDALEAPAEIADGLVLYRGAHPSGADLIHRPSVEGTEDFLHFDREPAQRKLWWSLDLGPGVAGLRLVAGVLEVLDANGAPRLRVRRPWLADASGARTDAELSVAGCAYDVDPAAPWGRPVVPPGARRCSVGVSWGASVRYPALLDPQWVYTSSMGQDRSEHQATVLQNGNVLISGGFRNGAAPFVSQDTELYDATTGVFAVTGLMNNQRARHTATLLATGRVLVTGGEADTAPNSYSNGETYNPATGTWTLVSNGMTTWRARHQAALLSDGTVLVIGGYNTSLGVLASADIYNPVSNQFSGALGMTTARQYFAAAAFSGGTGVVVTGGRTTTATTATTSCEVYQSGIWYPCAGNLASARAHHTATVLTDGNVLLTGGRDSSTYRNTAEVFNRIPWTLVSAGTFGTGRSNHAAVLRPNGTVLITGGEDGTASAVTTTAELFTAPSTWSVVEAMQRPRRSHTLSLLVNGDVLVTGGAPTASFGFDRTCELYQRRSNGVACGSGAQCESGYCADGVCCNTACSTTCVACTAAKSGAADGTCANVPVDTDPNSNCAESLVATCGLTGACTGSGACKFYATGTTCSAPSCLSGVLTSSACTAGHACQPAPTACPGNFACASASSCASFCTADAACLAGYWCRTSDGTCQADQANGAACTLASQCTSGNCVDGYCCDGACTASCEACSAAKKGSGANGTCGKVAASTDPDAECSDDGAASCGKTGSCNGTGACALYAPATACGTPACASGTLTTYTCNGSGACNVPASSSCGAYACASATACATSCGNDAQCAASYFCNTATSTCVSKLSTGAACTAASQCALGSCVDGFCCDTSCTGACRACSAAKKGSGTNGTCGNVAAGADPDAECATDPTSSCLNDGFCNGSGACRVYVAGTSCGASSCTGTTTQNNRQCDGAGTCGNAGVACGSGYACDAVSGTCRTSCTTDVHCAGGFYCNTGTGVCAAKLATSTPCSGAGQCQTGNCVDGFCCDGPCAGGCQACSAAKKATGANGACGPIKVDTDPDAECAPGGSACGLTGNCDGVGACKYAASGTVCGATTCASAIQTGEQCNGSGVCVTGTSTPCSTGYVCANGSVCATTCSADAQCSAPYYCRTSDGTCQLDLAGGQACASAAQCQSGYCVDGVCCNGQCNGTCQACSAAKTGQASGTCSPVVVDTDPDAECAAQASNTCGSNGFCDGIGACKSWPSGTVCGTTACAGGVQTGNQCNGTGACVSGSSTPCATGYACLDSVVCASTCTDDAQCAGGYWCSAGACVAAQAKGASCNRTRQCTSGNCVDGVCCDAPCGGLCQACSLAKTNQPSGTCAPVKLDTDPDNECSAAAQATCQESGNCDGAGGCRKWPFGTSCGTTSCANAAQTGQQCDGTGTCVSGQSTPCATGYVCATGTACATSCSSDAACASTYYCRTGDGTCQPRQAVGATCTTSSQCALGNCVDGVCCDGACGGACQACSAAKKGQGADGACGAIKVATDPDNECATQGTATCGTTGSCDGSGACQRYAAGTSCGTTVCSAGSPVDTQSGSSCDGFGTCQASNQTSCGLYRCSGSACATTCATNSACQDSAYCDTATHNCRADQANGAVCGSDAECASTHCVDGVCCAQLCNGACQACSASLKGAGVDGVCEPIQKGLDPESECADQGPSSCSTNGLCNGFGACDLYAAGTACGTTTCTPNAVTGGQQTGSSCNGSGSCVAASTSTCAPFVCQGASCGGACVTDADCIASYYCTPTGTCAQDKANGAVCTKATECTSGNCVDGVCCDSPCDGVCQACAATKTGAVDGQCRAVTSATDPDDDCSDAGSASCATNGLCSGAGSCAVYAAGTACGATTCSAGTQVGSACDGQGTCATAQQTSCGLYVCAGSACAASCAIDGDCVASAFCDLAAGTCRGDQSLGQTCDRDGQCQGGHCVDGVCCDQTCDGACQACSAVKKGQGGDGNCGAIATGADPDNECASVAPDTCGTDGACNGAGACRQYLPGTACGATQCSGSQLTGSQCDGFGACRAGQSTSCDPYVCTGYTSCPTSCVTSAQCVTGAFCASDGTCRSQGADGAACTGAEECRSGFCVEGVCCNSACDGTCQACRAGTSSSGADGVCGNATAGSDPHNDCDGGPVTDCDLDGTCDGNGACRLYPAGAPCGATSCDASGQTQRGFACDGTGTCQTNVEVPCELYACSGSACRHDCAADGDCAADAYCSNSVCVARIPNGEACTAANTCVSGYCVDGVCCDAACNGQCQACDVGGAVGKCSPVIGAPHGRTACAGATGTSPDELCQARTCDGTVDVTQCVGYVGSDVACRDQACSAQVQTFSASCDGHGRCGQSDGSVTIKQCAPFTCLDDKSCADACTSDAQCAPGNRCDVATSQCVSSTTCDDDHTLTAPNGTQTDCKPFRCTADGTCRDRCTVSDDCVSGYVCNDDRVCVSRAGGAPQADSGCGCRTTPPRSPVTAWLTALGTLLVAARRRRARSLG